MGSYCQSLESEVSTFMCPCVCVCMCAHAYIHICVGSSVWYVSYVCIKKQRNRMYNILYIGGIHFPIL